MGLGGLLEERREILAVFRKGDDVRIQARTGKGFL